MQHILSSISASHSGFGAARIVQDKGGKFFFEDHGDAAQVSSASCRRARYAMPGPDLGHGASQVIDSMIFERDLQKGEEV
eukprot:2047605-Rhodomonas_salina.4